MRRFVTLFVIAMSLAAGASSPPKQARSEFEDIPVPAGLTLDSSKSTVIESPSLKAARLVYKGRIEPGSLGIAFRTTLEANGWRHLTSATGSEKGTTQVYTRRQLPARADLRGHLLHLGRGFRHAPGHRHAPAADRVTDPLTFPLSGAEVRSDAGRDGRPATELARRRGRSPRSRCPLPAAPGRHRPSARHPASAPCPVSAPRARRVSQDGDEIKYV